MEKYRDKVQENRKSWLVASGSLFMTLIIVGPYRLSGLIYVVLIESYDADRKLAAMPIFMFVLVFSILGPVCGLIGEKLGAEKTTLLGFFFAALGFGGVFFTQNIVVVIILLGVVYGTGLTLGSSLISNILKKHFDSNYNTVNGIVKGGSCIGSFVFPPFAIYLLDTFGTAGTFLIIAGLMLNGIPIAMLVVVAGKDKNIANMSQKKLLLEGKESKPVAENEIYSTSVNVAISEKYVTDKRQFDDIDKIADLYKCKDVRKKGSGMIDQSDTNAAVLEDDNTEKCNINSTSGSNRDEAILVAKEIIRKPNGYDETVSNLPKKSNGISEKIYNVKINDTDNEYSEIVNTDDGCVYNAPTLTASSANFKLDSKDVIIFNNKKCIQFSNNYKKFDSLKANATTSETNNSNEHSKNAALLSTENSSSEKREDLDSPMAEIKHQAFWHSMKVFTNPTFLVLMTLASLLQYVLTLVWATLIDYSRDKGIPREYEVYLLMFHPLFDLVGRSCLVWVVDKGYVGYTMFQITAWVISTFSVLGLIMSGSFASLMTFAAMFALSTSGQLALSAGLVFRYLEKSEHMLGIASRVVLCGPLTFTVYPLIGYFRNELKSYDGVYYIAMAVCIFCCATCPLAARFSEARKRRRMKALEMKLID